MRPNRRILALGTTLALAIALSACAPSSEGQSRSDACNVVAEGLESVQPQVSGANEAIGTGDVLTVQSNLGEAVAVLTRLKISVTNDEVAPLLDNLIAGLQSVVDAVSGTDAAEAAEALQSSAANVQTAAKQFDEVCGG